MGSIDKLIKALDNLKVFQSDGIEEAATSTSKKKNETENTKEKITNCNILADCMCSPAVRSAAEFPKLLGVVIETLLSYANDKDSDVRMVSDESLNRITRALLDTNLGRLQIEFFKELKKNGPSRCVRSALWRFAELAPMIRLHKRRAFVVNLLSCVTKMAERHEEALQESLMSAMPNIASSLMVSATDAEVKLYIAPFLNNLCSTSAAVRRVASTCATVITLHSRKPLQLFNWLLVQVLDMVLPIMHSSCAENMPIILGCLHCIRHVVPLLDDEKVRVPRTNSTAHQGVPVEPSIKLDTTIMLFELMIHCLQQPHPSVITAALECYQQLLKTPTLPGLVDLLITPGSITTSILAVSYEATLSAKDKNVVKSNSELSIEDTDSNGGLEELQGNLALAPDVDQTDAVPSTAADDGQKEVLEEGEALTGESNSAEESKKDVREESTPSPDSGKSISDVIGSLTDAAQPPILYSVRLICHTFLLTGNTEERLYADRDVRVSIKSLALSCLLYILKFYPQAIEHQLYTSAHCENQPLSDVLLYHHHSDPQIQGMVAQVLGVLIHARVHCAQLINTTSSQVLESYFNMLIDLLNTESAMTTRLAVSAIKTCINTLLNSQYHQKALTLLEKALQHVNNSYWLVKSELLELVSELDMLPLVYLSGLSMQTKILDEVVLRLLGDSDHRVRQAASTALVALIPGLFHESDHPHQGVLLARATSHLNTLMYPFSSKYPIECPPLVHALPSPYHLASEMSDPKAKSHAIQSSLSKVVYRLLDMFAATSLQNTKLGICHALYKLSESYPVTKYPHAWSCAPGVSCGKKSRVPASNLKSNSSTTSSMKSLMLDELRVGTGGGPLTLVMSLLTHSPLSLDLGVHQDLLSLAGNLLSGACLSALKQGQSTPSGTERSWCGIYDRLASPLADKLLVHLIKLLNIFSHVLEDTSLVSSANPKAVLDAAREAITSPIKKRVGNRQDPQASDVPTEPKNAKEAEKVVKSKKEVLGAFNHIPFYMKLHESVKGAHLNYKVSLSLSKLDKFSSMLHHTLVVFSQLLEVASLQEIGKCAEEILHYLNPITLASPVAAIHLVQQLLKALFGTNLSSQYEDLVEKKVISRSQEVTLASVNPATSAIKPGLFTSCLATPYADFAQALAHNLYRVDTEDHSNVIYVIKRCEERKMPAVLKSGSTVDKNTVGAYIRLFEPLVIKALKMYTMNCSVYLQTQVLSLLVQLIQLRVNYCLLDNDGVYLKFLVKQVDMISEGPPREQAGLIRSIFQLLLLLSYEKLHSKTLITVPTIIQLCDGVMASGQNPTTHAIPALEMLVKDLFLCRSLNTSGNSDTVFHDIETQREVTASMLLRLIHHTKVLELLSLVLYQLMKDNEEKWKKLSRQIIDLLFPLISKQKTELESRGAMFSLQSILLAVSPSVYRPVDMLLKTLFTQPEHLGSRAMQERWLSSVLALFRVLLSIGKEEVILSRLNELEISFDRSLLSNSFMASGSFYSSTDEFTSTFRQMSESSESVISSSCGSVLPQELLASFLTQIVGFCAERLYADLSCPYLSKSDYEFSLQQLTLLLLYTSYMLQSGHFRKVAKFMTEQLKVKGSHLHQLVLEINDQIILVGKHYPTLTLQWSYILMLLNYDSHSWWEGVLRTPKDSDEDTEVGVSPLLTLHERIIKCTGLAMYCDYVVENMHDAQHLTWLTVNHVNDIIDQLHESPVSDFMSTVFGNSSASGLFISAIQSRYNMNSTPTKLYNVVSCLRNMHNEQSGAVTMLLIEKMMSSSHSGISRLCDSVACRRLEVLLSEDEQTVHKQLMAEDVLKMMVTLHNSKRTHRRLLSLVDKLRATFYPTALSPISLTQADIQSAQQNMADKDFYLLVTKSVCSDNRNSPKLCASLLGSLGLKDILSIMSGESFQLSCLAECIKHGADKSVRADTGTVVNIAHRVESESNQRISPLLAACETMLKQIWIKFAPTAETDATQNSIEDSTVYSQPVISVDVVNAISVYLTHCPLFLSRLQQSDILAICHIAVSYFERVKLPADHPLQSSQMMFSWTSHAEEGAGDMAPVDICQLYAHLSLLCHVFKHSQFTSVFASNPSHVFTVIDSLTYILNNLNVPGLTPELENYRETLAISQDGYIQISQLVTCLSDIILAGKAGLPSSLVFLLNNVIRGLARLPSVNEHARMPVTAFLMSSETREDNNKPQLKVDALQDTVVLRDFIKRNNLLGWISKPQFEETWACLLHLLSPVAVTGNVDIAEEDDVENIEWMVSALRGITGLLCQTLNRAQPGNPLCTCYKNAHRHKPIAFLLSSTSGEKLYQIRMFLRRKVSRCECMKEVDLFCVNTERVSCDIGYNQLSIGHLTTQMSTFSPLISSIEKADVESAEKSQPIKSLQGVDTASCLKLLIDVYSHLLSPSATPKTPLMLLNECAKSIVMLSDLFYEKSQFAWMFSTLYDLYLNHHAEDELMNQYVVLGLCKAAAIHLDSNMEEKLCKLLEQSFRSIHIPTRLAAISGILYLLEAAPEGDLVKSILNFLVDFISRSMDLINNKSTLMSELYLLSVWSLTFYLIEHFQEKVKTVNNFIPQVLQTGMEVVNSSDNNSTTRLCSAVLLGFERLLLVNALSKSESVLLLKFASDRLSLPATHINTHSILGLLVTCMYADISEADENRLDTAELKMEVVSILFDRIRRGLPQESEVITGILPTLMSDLFSSQDIMNKVIGEFLSEQQPHPVLIAKMVYEVFEEQATVGGNSFLQDWVLLSITSFTQRHPLAMAIWSLTCFFVSVSSNHWLKGLFPYVASRIGCLDEVDEKIFLLSCKDFYDGICHDSHKSQTFVSVFQSAGRTELIYKTVLEAIAAT